jgi:hypothetical protein
VKITFIYFIQWKTLNTSSHTHNNINIGFNEYMMYNHSENLITRDTINFEKSEITF